MSPRMLWSWAAVALAAAVAALVLAYAPAAAAPAAPQLAQTEILVTPRKDIYLPGDVVTVTVQLSQLENFYGADLGWSFDAAALQVVDANPNLDGVQVKAGNLFPGGSFFVQNLVENDTGLIRFVASRLNPAPPASGSGTVAVVTFRVVGACADTLLELKPRTPPRPELGTLSLSDPDGIEIQFQEAIPFTLRTPACPNQLFLPHLSQSWR